MVVKKPLKVISNVLLQEEETPCHLASELSRETVKELIHTQHEEFPKVSLELYSGFHFFLTAIF